MIVMRNIDDLKDVRAGDTIVVTPLCQGCKVPSLEQARELIKELDGGRGLIDNFLIKINISPPNDCMGGEITALIVR